MITRLLAALVGLCVFGSASARAEASFAAFDARARAGDRLTVVFFGGSLTWSANASDPNVTGFRGLMARRFIEKYPAAHFTFVDASIGGTGSNLGMFRLERDVFAKKPDLVFLDFACNDGGEHTEIANTCCYEYLLREMISRGVPVQQMFFTFAFWTKPGTVPSKVHPRRDIYWRLARAYRTPVGDVYEMPLWKQLNRGDVPIKTIWPIDEGHPGDLGYRMFADAGFAGYEKGVNEGAVCRVPEKPVFGTVQNLRRWNPADESLPKGWRRAFTYRTSAWYDGLSSRWMDDVAAFNGGEAEPLVCRAKGNFIGLLGEGDNDSLAFTVSADGREIFRGSGATGVGRLFFWRYRVLDGWRQGSGDMRTFTVMPKVSGKIGGELRLGSVCMATIVPVAGVEAAAQPSSGDALEKLDHARGK